MARTITKHYELSPQEELLQDIYVTLKQKSPDIVHDVIFLSQLVGAVVTHFELGKRGRLVGYRDVHEKLVRIGEISDGYAFFGNGQPLDSIYKGNRTDLPENHEWIAEIGKITNNEGYIMREVLTDIIKEAEIDPNTEFDAKEAALRTGRIPAQVEQVIERYRQLAGFKNRS